jgi:WS/DGAT C-terminal domain
VHSTDRILPQFQQPLWVGDRVIRMARYAPSNPVALFGPGRGRSGAGAARDGAHLAAPRAAGAGTRQPGRGDDGGAAAGEPDPVRRLELIAAETAARKRKARPQVTSGIFRFVAAQRATYRLQAHQRFVNLTVTNVPVPLYLAGARLLELFPVVPILGNVTLDVGVLSYAGQLNLTVVADQDTCPDVEVFAQGGARPWTPWPSRCSCLPHR